MIVRNFILSALCAAVPISTATADMISRDALSGYLSAFDLRWDTVPADWGESAFNGNGRLGVMVWQGPEGGLRFHVGDAMLYNRTRVPIGEFTLMPQGPITAFSMRQHLYESEITGEITTTEGRIHFRCYADFHQDLVLLEMRTEGGEAPVLHHIPLPAMRIDILNRQLQQAAIDHNKDLTEPSVYQAMYDLPSVKALPAESRIIQDGIEYRTVPFDTADTGYIMAWQTQTDQKTTRLLWSIASYDAHDATDTRVFLEAQIREYNPETASVRHRSGWAEFFSQSFLSIPDKQVEKHYWIQVYKMRAATRPGAYPIDLMGPWFRITPWAQMWANLNIQITYPVMNRANQLDTARTLYDFMDAHNEHFINAVPPAHRAEGAAIGRAWSPQAGTSFAWEYGNFLWLMQTYSEFLAHFPDEQRRRENYYPLLKRGIHFVLAHLERDADGTYHFPPDISPEYKVPHPDGDYQPRMRNTNYNIAYLQWALNEALRLGRAYEDDRDLLARYEAVASHLAPFQVDPDTGLMVGEGYPMDYRHRHWSHLAPFYPLALLDVDQQDAYALARKSVDRWLDRPRYGWGYKGYTYTGATAMYAWLSDGDTALRHLHTYLDTFPTPNTFYLESGPVIETPFHAASATLELLAQSFNRNPDVDDIRVFTALPSGWEHAAFDQLRTHGGHLVSAQYNNGAPVYIHVEAGSDRTVHIRYPGPALPHDANGSPGELTTPAGTFQTLTIALKAGESVTLGTPLNE